jgi:signal transduction histidine kinase
MSLLRAHRLRLSLLWATFAAAALATGFGVFRLYDTVRSEIRDQSGRALREETEKARDRVLAYTEEARRSIIAELAGFHVDGLGRALRQWDDANEVITGTFQWEAARGFFASGEFPPGADGPEEIATRWRQFREWRAANPAATARESGADGAIQTREYRTLDNPTFAPAGLGYQAENLDVLAYDGRVVDPWAGWAGRADRRDAAWLIWYQAGPDAAVRGCFVDVGPMVSRLRGELGEQRLAQIELVPASPDGPARGGAVVALAGEGLPGWALVASPGQVFLEKESSALFAVVTVALLFGVFLLGVGWLAVYSRREARDAERKTTFVSQVSHELRTPLTSIRMFADMLATPGLPEEKRTRYAGTISRESQRLAALIERLLAFNALDKGKLAISVDQVEVCELVKETLDETDGVLRTAGMRAETELPGSPVMASADRSTLKQALLNLLDNATKYARNGGIVRVVLENGADVVRLRVSDRGPGIPPEVRARLFEPFVQGGRSLSDKPSGVGLGLSIARGMLRAAGGDLVLLSSNEGASFEIRLAADRPANSPS